MRRSGWALHMRRSGWALHVRHGGGARTGDGQWGVLRGRRRGRRRAGGRHGHGAPWARGRGGCTLSRRGGSTLSRRGGSTLSRRGHRAHLRRSHRGGQLKQRGGRRGDDGRRRARGRSLDVARQLVHAHCLRPHRARGSCLREGGQRRARRRGSRGDRLDKRVRHLADRGEARVRLALEDAPEERVERPRELGREGRWRRRRLLADLQDEVAWPVALKREPACERAVQDDTHGPQIGPVVDGLQPTDLLRAHVGGGPEDVAGHGGLARAAVASRPRDAKIQDLDHLRVVGARQEDVRRLQVAVDDAQLVRTVEPPRDLREELRGPRGGEALLPAQAGPQIFTVEKLHDHVRSLAVKAVVVNLHDVRALDLGRRLGLATETNTLIG